MMRRLLLVGLLLALLPSPGRAQTYDPNRTLVVFGGFGYVDDIQNRRLIELLLSGAQSDAPQDGLEQRLRTDASKAVGSRFGRWTRHPLVFDAEDLSRVFARTPAAKATQSSHPDTIEMLGAFDRVYLLVLSSGLEHEAVLRTDYAVDATYHSYTEVGVSASLLDLRGSGDIVLSATAIGIHDSGALSRKDEPDDPVWRSRYHTAYLSAAGRALSLLANLADKTDPRKQETTFETYMVTGARVEASPSEEGQLASRVFEWTPSDSPVNYCRPVTGCAQGSNACALLSAYLVTSVSQVLSQKGLRVLPPLTWKAAARDTDALVRFRLSLPASPLPELAASAEFDFDPRRATHKTIASLQAVTHSHDREKTGILAVDVYGASVNATIAKTDPDSCAARPKGESVLDSKGRGYGDVKDTHPAAERPLDIGALRFQYLRAINLAFAQLTTTGGR